MTNSTNKVEERRKRLYRKQQDGMTARALVLDHASRESVSERTAWDDWKQVRNWNDEDWSLERETTISRIQTMRFRAIAGAMKNKNFSAARDLLADMGKVCNESTESINIQAPQLSIKVEDKKS